MRRNIRIKLFGHTFFLMFAKTQTLEGVTSLQPNGKHIIMWDLEKCSLQQAKKTLLEMQIKYGLSDIFIVSDAEESFRGWCFSKVDFKTFLQILLDTKFLDWNFFWWTVKRGKATLRVSNKENRASQEIVSVLYSFSEKIPDSCERVVYDTGVEKRGASILLGD